MFVTARYVESCVRRKPVLTVAWGEDTGGGGQGRGRGGGESRSNTPYIFISAFKCMNWRPPVQRV